MARSEQELASRRIARVTGFSVCQIREVLAAYLDYLKETLVERGEVRLREIAVVRLRIRPEHIRFIPNRTFDPIKFEEKVYARVDVSKKLEKEVNKKYNSEDPTYREQLRKKLGPIYQKAVLAERAKETRSENKIKYRKIGKEADIKVSNAIVLKTLQMVLPDVPEEEIAIKVGKAMETLTPMELEAEKESLRAIHNRYRERQAKYQEWLSTYASPGHKHNKGRKKEDKEVAE